MPSALGSVQVPPDTPETEPAICAECGNIANIPKGVEVICTLHEEKAQMLNMVTLFKVLVQGLPQKQIPEVMAIWSHYLQRMRELQEHILPEDQVVTAGPTKH